MAHTLLMATIFCWEIHSPLKQFLELQGILTYGFSLILPCICGEMGNSDNMGPLYYTECVYSMCHMIVMMQKGVKVYSFRLESSDNVQVLRFH
jgi:hypothetical protein